MNIENNLYFECVILNIFQKNLYLTDNQAIKIDFDLIFILYV